MGAMRLMLPILLRSSNTATDFAYYKATSTWVQIYFGVPTSESAEGCTAQLRYGYGHVMEYDLLMGQYAILYRDGVYVWK